MSEHHDCAVPDCAAWGVQRFTGRIPGVTEHVEGWLCESHRYQPPAGSFSVGYQMDAQGEPLVVGPPIPVPQAEHEHFHPINRAARRKAARGRKR